MSTGTSSVYGLMSVTAYYGPREARRLVAANLSEAEARKRAIAYNPDYDPTVQCCRLAHNQSRATVGVPVAILGAVDPNQLTDLIDAATEERAIKIVRERYDDTAEARRVLDGRDGGEGWYDAIEEALGERGGYVVAEADDETGELTGDWYLVQTLDRAGR